MSATQYKEAPVSAYKVETRSSWLRKVLGLSPAATVVELGATIAGADASAPKATSCPRCKSPRNSHTSDAQNPNTFCSKECEQEFVRVAVASLTLEDCIRMQERLESLLANARGISFSGETEQRPM